MEDQSYVEEGYEDYVEDQQYEDYSNMGDGTEISKGEFRSSKDIRADDKQVNWCLLQWLSFVCLEKWTYRWNIQPVHSAGLTDAYTKLDDILNAHLRFNGEGLFACALCEYSSKNSANVKTHIESKHVSEADKQIQCHVCHYVCPSRSAHRMHMKKKHPWLSMRLFPDEWIHILIGRIPAQSQDLTNFLNDNLYSENGVFYCGYCEYSSKTKANVKTHLESKHVDKAATQMPCSICHHVCPNRNALRMHMKRQHSNI